MMSKLMDAINKRNKHNNIKQVAEPDAEQKPLDKYTRAWAGKITLYQGYELSDDNKKVDGILAALNRRDGQCPCGGNGAQYKCPCVIMREKNICKCGLWKTLEDRKITSSPSVARIKVDNE